MTMFPKVGALPYGAVPTKSVLHAEHEAARQSTKAWWIDQIHTQLKASGGTELKNVSMVLDVIDPHQAVVNLKSALIDYELNGYAATLHGTFNLDNAKAPKTGPWNPPRVEFSVRLED